MRRKGFTLVELLVVIAIIALLMGILMPALARVRQLAYRMVCGTNLAGLGKAVLIYSNDNEEEYPRSGGRDSAWADGSTWSTNGNLGGGTAPQWSFKTAEEAYANGKATIGSCWFLLIKYADVTVKQFVCKGDVDTRAFKLSEWLSPTINVQDITDAWDFGRGPGRYCSYAYHNPFTPGASAVGPNFDNDFPITSNSPPDAVIAADRSPYLDKNALLLDATTSEPEDTVKTPSACDQWDVDTGYVDEYGVDNSVLHQNDGQNVLYNDGSVDFAKFPNVGINKDNIYQYWPVTSEGDFAAGEERKIREACGEKPNRTTSVGLVYPSHPKDALLVMETQTSGFGP